MVSRWYLGAYKPDGFMSKVTAAFLSGNVGAGRPGALVEGFVMHPLQCGKEAHGSCLFVF